MSLRVASTERPVPAPAPPAPPPDRGVLLAGAVLATALVAGTWVVAGGRTAGVAGLGLALGLVLFHSRC